MSNRWVIAAVGIFAVVVILFGCVGLLALRARSFSRFSRQPQRVERLEVRLVDDDEDGIPDRGIAVMPGSAERQRRPNQDFLRGRAQLDVRLIDDDQDGIPDRGLVEPQIDPEARSNFGPGQNYGRGFGPRRGPGRFGPFTILRPLIGLACLLSLVIGAAVLGAFAYKHWGGSASTRSSASGTTAQPKPDISGPGSTEQTPAQSSRAVSETDEAGESAPIEDEPSAASPLAGLEDEEDEPDPPAGEES